MTAINFFHFAPAIEMLESITIWSARVYAIGVWNLHRDGNPLVPELSGHDDTTTSGLVMLSANFTASTYTLSWKSFVVRVIALVILLGQLTFEGAQVLYNNRNEILENINIFRDTVGSYFVYAWLVTTNCATSFSGTVNEHSAQNRVLYSQLRNSFMFDELWSEIADAPGEIFDVIEYKEEWEKEEKFDVESYINGDTDYWG